MSNIADRQKIGDMKQRERQARTSIFPTKKGSGGSLPEYTYWIFKTRGLFPFRSVLPRFFRRWEADDYVNGHGSRSRDAGTRIFCKHGVSPSLL